MELFGIQILLLKECDLVDGSSMYRFRPPQVSILEPTLGSFPNIDACFHWLIEDTTRSALPLALDQPQVTSLHGGEHSWG